MGTLHNVTAGIDLSTRVRRASGPIERAVGWLGVAAIAPDEGKWLSPCSAIHTLGMRSAIDIIFLDAKSIVLAVQPRVVPNRLLVSNRRAQTVIEMGPGFLDSAAVSVGQLLTLVEPPEIADASGPSA